MSKKGENIYKRTDNRWEARYIKSYRPDGTAKYGYCYGKTYREAKQKFTFAKMALLNGVPEISETKRRRFAFYCDEWLRMNRTRVKEATYIKYATNLEKHIKPHLGGYLVGALSSVVVEQFGHDLLFEEGLSPKTVKDIMTTLHSIIKYTAKQFSEPLPNIEILYPKVPKSEIRVLTKEEQSIFISYLLKDINEYKSGILFALLTGMRIGEICALRWENISIDDQIVVVNSTMQRLKNLNEQTETKTKIVITSPKSDTSSRVIPLTKDALFLCKMRFCENPCAFFLTGETDRYIEPRIMQYHLEKYTKECGLSGVHFHTLRHTFATRCVEVDFEIKSLSEILGHSSPRITLERYVHTSMELKRYNMNKLPTISL